MFARIGWTRSLVAVLALSVVVIVTTPPAAARAEIVVPVPPVAEIPGLPSQAVRALTGAKLVDGTTVGLLQIWKAAREALKAGTAAAPSTALVPTAAALPKPITPAIPLLKAGGGLAVGFSAGWQVGKAGLSLYALATNQSVNKLVCQSPTWYQGIDTAVNFGLGSDCTAYVPQPNSDVQAGTTITLDGVSWGTKPFGPTNKAYCGPSAQLPAGEKYQYFFKNSSGSSAQSDVGYYRRTSDNAQGACAPSGALYAFSMRNADPLEAIKRVSTSNGAVLSSASPVTQTPNPTRQNNCRMRWSDGSYTEALAGISDDLTGFKMGDLSNGCGLAFQYGKQAGKGDPTQISVESTTQDGAKTVISDQTVPVFGPSERMALDPKLGNGHGLVLEKVVADVAASCNTWAADCAQWWSKTNSGTQETVGTETFRCSYGGQKVALTECGPYRQTFDTKTNTPTITDPATGNQVGWEASTDPGNSTNPIDGPTPGEACMAQWSSAANPIERVLQPLKCALVWAFVPRGSEVSGAQGKIGSAWTTSSLGAIAASVTGMATMFNGASGCAGLPFDISMFGIQFHGRLFEACSEPWAGVAATVRNLLGGIIVVASVMAIVRYAAGVFGFVGLGIGLGDRNDEPSGPRFR